MQELELSAEVEQVDPFEDLSSYGSEQLLTDLINAGELEGDGLSLGPELLEAFRNSDYTAIQRDISAVREWLGRDDRYTVLRSGTVQAEIPLLALAADDVPGLEVSAKQATATSAGGEISLKVAGTGVGATTKVTISESVQLDCASGEQLVAMTSLPVFWETRAHPDNEDFNWIHTEMAHVTGPVRVTIKPWQHHERALAVSTVLVDNRGGGAKGAKFSKSFAFERGASFSVGLKLDAIGLDTSLKVTAGSSITTDLAASLPSGHRYEVSWLAGPWGARVVALD